MSTARSRIRVHHMLFGWINFALTAPAIYLWLGLPLVMRQQGWSGAEIGLFQLAGLPAAFKLFLALPIERWRPGHRPYLHWAWLTGGGYLLALLSLATLGADTHKAILFALTFLAALCATWADIPVNALAIKLFPPEERPRAGGVRSAATFAGAVVGGGTMLLLQQAFGWAAPFLFLSLCLVAGLGLLGFVQEDGRVSSSCRSAPLAVWCGFFRQTGAGIWTVTLLGYFPFVAAAWIYLKPLLLDSGFPATEVAWIAGIGGGALGALASFTAGLVPRALVLRGITALRWHKCPCSRTAGRRCRVRVGNLAGRCRRIPRGRHGRGFHIRLRADDGIRPRWLAGSRLWPAGQPVYARADRRRAAGRAVARPPRIPRHVGRARHCSAGVCAADIRSPKTRFFT